METFLSLRRNGGMRDLPGLDELNSVILQNKKDV
jgi:hypothetical protein